MQRIGVDIGGTFTDLVLWDEASGDVTVHKLPSTPSDPSLAGIAGIKQLCAKAGTTPAAVGMLFHGTTVATNIILERNGARVGLLTTEGFRDILHIGRKKRPLNFSHQQDVARQSYPLVPRRWRKPVAERITSTGEVETALDETAVRLAVRELKAEQVEAIAICGLFSFLNPVHEIRMREIVAEEAPALYVCASHEVVPLYREYERFSTTALNAYVGPKTASYLDRFSTGAKRLGLGSELHLMTSSGGVIGAAAARRSPVSLLLSGPVGALVAGIECGREAGYPSVITLDVGGTSADIGVAPDGEMRFKHLLDTAVGDYDAMMPMVDIDTIGAGGGSIAYLDSGGMFHVGPRSAGALPGPACYHNGGTEPTVTDAIVALGWYRAEALIDSGLDLKPALAASAIDKHIGTPLGLSVLAAAGGIYRIITNNMVEAIRVNSVARGFDPRDFALVAYGGAGAAFVMEIAARLAIPTVIIPTRAGVGAAAGLLSTDMKYEYLATLWQTLARPAVNRIETTYRELAGRASAQLREDGFAAGQTSLRYWADCRYQGQGYELSVQTPPLPVDDAWIHTVCERFHAAHEQAHLRRFDDKPIMLINVRVSGVGQVPRLRVPEIEAGAEAVSAEALLVEQQAYFLSADGVQGLATRFYSRPRLKAGNVIAGPAIIEQSDTTTVLPPGWRATVDRYGNLIVAAAESEALTS
jgi:N-methylhydantoinase A/oxoprolinase/acetone carboxylase beta subunit